MRHPSKEKESHEKMQEEIDFLDKEIVRLQKRNAVCFNSLIGLSFIR